jgi:hypothetical protein
MDRMPIGMASCMKTGANHSPVMNMDSQRVECMDCEIPIEEWNIFIPERNDTVALWLSNYTIPEEPF